jgi:hypothetical protein
MSRLGIVCLIVFALALPASALTLNFEPKAVVAKEVTPGGSAVVFAVPIDFRGGMRVRDRVAVVLRDDDGDGVVRYERERGVSRVGIWGVVDVTTGTHALTSPYGAVSTFLVDGAFRGDESGEHFPRFAFEVSSAEVLVVRPGVGVWRATAREGGDDDGDFIANGMLVLPANRFEPLEGTPAPPEHLLPGDVVLLIDADSMRAGATTLKRAN